MRMFSKRAAARPDTLCTIRMTADAATAAALRRLAVLMCGDALEFVRVAVCAGSSRMQVWMRERIARELPGAGAIAGKLPRRRS